MPREAGTLGQQAIAQMQECTGPLGMASGLSSLASILHMGLNGDLGMVAIVTTTQRDKCRCHTCSEEEQEDMVLGYMERLVAYFGFSFTLRKAQGKHTGGMGKVCMTSRLDGLDKANNFR